MTDTPAIAEGRVARVVGPVVDVEFPPDRIPPLYNALTVEVNLAGQGEGESTFTMTLEVAQHLGDNLVRTIALKPTDGLVRGTPVTDTGAPISVPVGDVTKGHVFNVTGDVLTSQRARPSRSPSAGRSTASPRPLTSSRRAPRCSRPASRSSTC